MSVAMQTRRILSVTVHREADDSLDLSYLGEYGSRPTSPAAIDRQERGDMGRGEFRYFNPALTGEETGNSNSPEEDYQRMEAYNRGDWGMVGVYVSAQVVLTGDVVQTIRSGGLWGIESDSGDDYTKSVVRDELSVLHRQLSAVGFTTEEIEAAVADAKRRDIS